MILIDTNIAIDLRDVDMATVERLAGLEDDVAISAISWIELEGGVARDPALSDVRRIRLDEMLADMPVLMLEADDIRTYGAIIAACGFNRWRTLDRLIAAQCLVRCAGLLTRNPRDFRDVAGLELIEW